MTDTVIAAEKNLRISNWSNYSAKSNGCKHWPDPQKRNGEGVKGFVDFFQSKGV
jgi:hypothetical protein